MINNKFWCAKVEKFWLRSCFLTVFISFKVNYFPVIFRAGLHTCLHRLSALVLPAKAVFRNGWRVAPLSLLTACYTSAFAGRRCRCHPCREEDEETKGRRDERMKERIWECGDVEIWRCGDVEMWEYWEFGNLRM